MYGVGQVGGRNMACKMEFKEEKEDFFFLKKKELIRFSKIGVINGRYG